MTKIDRSQKIIAIWLGIGLLMVFVQVIIGGVTRLTGSGLSITKWEIVTGTFPPMSEASWNEEFEAYKATPQYEKMNAGMTLSAFKFIYFWEYFHRLWARIMGFVFMIPLMYFLAKGWVSPKLKTQLLIVFLLAALVAGFGWIMVASGLVDRPWVSPYKLSMHLGLAFVLVAYLTWLLCDRAIGKGHHFTDAESLRMLFSACFTLLWVQIILGGLMSGMKAALDYPTWPLMGGAFVPEVLWLENLSLKAFLNYDSDTGRYAKSFIQFFHRTIAYLLVIALCVFSFRVYRRSLSRVLRILAIGLTIAILSQLLIGILTVLNSIGQIPVDLGVYHQGIALLVLTLLTAIGFHLKHNRENLVSA